MSDIVDLGSFEFDMSAVEKALVQNKIKLEEFNASIAKNKKTLLDNRKELSAISAVTNAVTAAQADLNEQYALGAISEAELMTATIGYNQQLEDLQKRSAEVSASTAEMVQQNHELEKSTRALAEENRVLVRLFEGGVEELEDNAGGYQKLNKELNALKQVAKDLGAEMYMLERAGKKDTDEYRALAKQFEEAAAEADAMNTAFKDIDKAVGDNQRTVGDYRDQIVAAVGDLRGGIESLGDGDILGAMQSLQGGLDSIKETANSAFKAIALNPFLALAAAVAFALKSIYDYNVEVTKTNTEIEALTGNLPILNNELRKMGEAVKAVYEDSNVAETANELDYLIKAFGVSSAEAFDIYTTGLARGGAANDEFKDSITEFSGIFAKNGYSAKEFIDLLNAGIDLKLFKDTLPNAVKEAGLALTEAGKATRDALVNAFGAQFSDDILKRVSSGKLTVNQALDEIAKKAETSNLNQQQLAQLTADLFKSAGEDLGGAEVLFEAFNKAQDATNGKLSETAQVQKDLIALNKQYEDSLDEAFNVGPISDFNKEAQKLWVKLKTMWAANMNAIAYITKYVFSEISASTTAIVKGIYAIPKGISELFKALKTDISNLGGLLGQVGQIAEDAFNFRFDKARAGIDALKKNINDYETETSKVFKRAGASIENNYNAAYDKLIKKQKESITLTEAEAKARANADKKRGPGNDDDSGEAAARAAKAAADAEKARQKALKDAETDAKKSAADLKKDIKDKEDALKEAGKRLIEAQKQEADARIEIAKNELAEYITLNSKKYEDDKRVTAAKFEDQKSYFAEVERLSREANEKELAAKYASLDAASKAEGVTTEQLAAIESERATIKDSYRLKDVELKAKTDEEIKKLTESREAAILEIETYARAVGYQQRIVDLEAQHAGETEIRKVQLEADAVNELAAFRKTNELKAVADQENYDLQAELKASRKELEDQIAIVEDENEKARIESQLAGIALIESKYAANTKALDKATNEAKLDAYQSAFGSLKSLFGESTAVGKAAAVAETTINTYKAATAAYAAGAALGGPLGAVMGPVLAGLAVASGLANVKKILSVKESYATGGYTGSGGKYEVAGDVHRGEVVWTQEDVARVGGPANAEALRPFGAGMPDLSRLSPSYAGFSGMLANSNNASVYNDVKGSAPVIVLDQAAVDQISSATASGTQGGLSTYSENIIVEQNANF